MKKRDIAIENGYTDHEAYDKGFIEEPEIPDYYYIAGK